MQVDHYNRVAKDTKKRVVGVLLGEKFKGRVPTVLSCSCCPHTVLFKIKKCRHADTHKHPPQIDVLNSYAVPFEEDAKSPNIWCAETTRLGSFTICVFLVSPRFSNPFRYLDHNYHENMFDMFKKVPARHLHT